MDQPTIWWLLAGITVAVELVTGTFYLLMIALGLAAAALAPLCDWADLDGPFLTSNNPYKDPDFKDGKWVLSDLAGLGLLKS